MRVIIAGSRSIFNYGAVSKAIEDSGFEVTEVVSGGARGVDRAGAVWGIQNGVKVTPFDAEWDNVDAPGAVIKRRHEDGKPYNARAGFDRNQRMADYTGSEGSLVLVWDGRSGGAADMRRRARKAGMRIYEVVIGD